VQRLDLAILRVDPDGDGDGLPDWWERQFPGGNTDPALDSDGDGVIDEHEYRAGTDPMDPLSYLQISITADDLGFPVLLWGSAPGKTYRLLRANSPLTPVPEFQEVQRNVGATPPWNLFQDWSATSAGPYFYLLQVEE
jgi:hypothetical protein